MKVHKLSLDTVSLVILICGLVPGVLGQTDDNPKVIAATFFITILFVLVLGAIVWCILRRYQRVKQMRKSPRGKPLDNPAFSDNIDSIQVDEGVSESIKDHHSPNMEPEVISADLLSQDFTGLGFNISGNMRNGIYIDEVRNRGPAKESGKLKAGDLIKEVSISFKNIVFKDALAILGYASPYPVKVTVEKQKAVPNRPIITKAPILHPVLRSHSANDLYEIVKEPPPKVPYNELKVRGKSPSIVKMRGSTNSSLFNSESDISLSPGTLEVVVHSDKERDGKFDKEKKILPEKDNLVNSQNLRFPSLASQADRNVDGRLRSREDISNIDDKMDLQFSKYDKEFLDLKHEAEEKSTGLELEVPDNERKRSLNSESEFAELERSIRYSAHFSELYDKINDKSNIPRFNPEKLSSNKTPIEDTISVATNQTAMSQNPNIRKDIPNKNITNGIIPDNLSVGNDFTDVKPFSLNSETVFKENPSLEAEITPIKKDVSLKSPFKNPSEIPSFDGNFTDLNEIQEPKTDMAHFKSSTENLFTMPVKFVRKEDVVENSFSKYIADSDSDASDSEMMKIPSHDETAIIQLDPPDIPTRMELTKDHDVINLPSRDLQNNVDLHLSSDELETNEDDSVVKRAKGLLSTDDNFKNKIWDRNHDSENNVDTSFPMPLFGDDEFSIQSLIKKPTKVTSLKLDESTGSSSSTDMNFDTFGNKKNEHVKDEDKKFGVEINESENTGYKTRNPMLTSPFITGFLRLDDNSSLMSETDDSYSPKLAAKKFHTSEASPYHSDNDSIKTDSALKFSNHDMTIETDTKFTLNESSDSNINSFIKEDMTSNSKPNVSETTTEAGNTDFNSPNSSETKGKQQDGFFSKAIKKVQGILHTESPADVSSTHRNHSDISLDSSQENNPDLSDRNISPRDIHISTDSDEEHNKKDEAFFEMTEDEQSTDTQSLSPKSTLTNPISLKISTGNDELLPTSLEAHNDTTLNHLDGEDHREDASSPQTVDTSRIVSSWSEINEDNLKAASDKHLKFNGKDLSPASETLSRPSFSDSNFSVSSDETKTNPAKLEILNITTPAKFEPRPITISYNTSNHDTHDNDTVTSTDSSWDSHDTSSFDPF
ncbi:uncharacterized protein LOC115217417 isoform X2 [Octopus sinensis]|uniref:Uncharacterized protein LOC115217417 isoform X2 n=1 Tax=Octopus sinensis TaxID=2607531 RepID=A0A6P7SXT0_9MOLL|nr:uncharacterized protein LOC115217417 isoform X2 [Octopus sinensis]